MRGGTVSGQYLNGRIPRKSHYGSQAYRAGRDVYLRENEENGDTIFIITGEKNDRFSEGYLLQLK